MFELEKDMIPVLKKYLSQLYETDYFIDEFNSGNWIADLVFTSQKIERKHKLLLNYELTYILHKYIGRKKSKISVKLLCEWTGIKKKQAQTLIDFLIDNEIIDAIDEKMISIEAKLSDWKGGMYQAIRYKTYSHRSYLAISEEFLHRVDIDMLRKNNIGLISVSPDRLKFALKVKDETPKNTTAYTYLSEKMAHSLLA